MNGVKKMRPDIQIRRLKGNIAAVSQQHKRLKEKHAALGHQLNHAEAVAMDKDGEIEKLREALISLYQLQEGPPSLNHEDEWREAMRLAKQTLEETKP